MGTFRVELVQNRLTIESADDTVARLEAAAAERGLSAQEFVIELIGHGLEAHERSDREADEAGAVARLPTDERRPQ